MPRPFSSGTQYSDWTEHNCGSCIWAQEFGGTCSIETALLEAYVGDGEVEQEILDRMGYVKGRYSWRCPEHNYDA